MKKITVEEYIRALEKMKRSPQDRIGTLGELGVTGIGVTAGAVISGSIAAAAGASTLAGSTTLATIAGGIFVTATPVGWVIGSAIAGGSLAYALSKLIRDGDKNDRRKATKINELEERIRRLKNVDICNLEGHIQKLRRESNQTDSHDEKIKYILTCLQLLVVNSWINQEESTEILADVETKKRTVKDAFEAFEEIAHEKSRYDHRIIKS